MFAIIIIVFLPKDVALPPPNALPLVTNAEPTGDVM
jgi:hypothetical protein